MRGAIWFRIASVLIAIFAAGHTFGFRQIDSKWGLNSALAAIKSIRVTTQGFTRTYWDFYVGFGLFVTVFLLLAAVFAWQLGGTPPAAVATLRPLAWALTSSFAIVALLSWRFFFFAPVIFSVMIFGCLLAGTLLSVGG